MYIEEKNNTYGKRQMVELASLMYFMETDR